MTQKRALSIEILEDGKLLARMPNNKIEYIQPPIQVDALDNIDVLEVSGEDQIRVHIDTTINEIDNVPFSGTFDQLETEIRNLAKASNSLLYSGGQQASEDGGVDKIIEQLSERSEVSYFDLSTSTISPFASFPITVNNVEWNDGVSPAVSVAVAPTVVNDTTELASIFNANIPDNVLEARDASSVFIKAGTQAVPTDVNAYIQFTAESPFAILFYSNGFSPWMTEQDEINSEVNNIKDKVCEFVDGTALLVTRVGKTTYTPTVANNAIVIDLVDAQRESIIIQIYDFDVWIRLRPSTSGSSTRNGVFVPAGSSFKLDPLENGKKYLGEISLINAIDGEIPSYSLLKFLQ